MNKKLFLVGLWKEENKPWELCGVFDNKNDALRRCTHDQNFIGEVIINESIPEETVKWENFFYPHIDETPEWFK